MIQRTKKYKNIFEKFFKTKNIKSSVLEDIYSNEINLLEAIRHVPDMMFQVDKNLRIVWANESLLNYSADVIGKYCPELCNSSDMLHLSCYCKKAIETGNIQKSYVYMPESNGIYAKSFWEGTGIPVKNENGAVVGALGIIHDITNIVNARDIDFITGQGQYIQINNLANSESGNTELFFRELAWELNSGIIVFDIFHRIRYWNKFMEILTGLSARNVIDRNFNEIFLTNSDSDLSTAFSNVDKGESSFLQEAELELKSNGNTFWITGELEPKYSLTNEFIGIILTIRYFRESKISENLQQETGETLNALINSSPAAIMILGKDRNVKIWNPAAEDIFGWDEKEIIGKENPITDISSTDGYWGIFTKVMKGQIITNYEMISTRKDGNLINIILSASPLKDTRGEIKGVVYLFTNITENKLSEEALLESELRYRSFVRNFQGIAYRLLPNKNLVFINGAVENLTGYTESDFLEGKVVWRNLIKPEDLYLLLEQDDKIGIIPGFESDLEYRILRKDKAIRWIHEHLQNISDRHSNVIYVQGTFQDVTQRKEAEEELKRSREHLRNLALHVESTREEEKKHIAFEIHDELGHALTALKLELSWIIKKKHLRQDVMLERVKKMSDMIDSTIRKVRSISSELRPSVLDHFGLIAAIEWQTAEFQKRSAVRCRLNMEISDIKLDEKRSIAVFRIFQEVLTNVARHAQATRIDIHLEKVENTLVLRVSDNGKGIKQDQINNRKSFGLISMNERANALGGKLTISGVIGIGTTVILKLPITD